MISKPVLKELVSIRMKDAKALYEKRRYNAAIYIAGYAIEVALKYKICKILVFSHGFTENKVEFQNYHSSRSKKLLRQTVKSLQDIKTHDLSKLLFYSGVEYQIKSRLLNELLLTSAWSPELRYEYIIVRKTEASRTLSAVNAILKEIF
jgi:hypothetical protein